MSGNMLILCENSCMPGYKVKWWIVLGQNKLKARRRISQAPGGTRYWKARQTKRQPKQTNRYISISDICSSLSSSSSSSSYSSSSSSSVHQMHTLFFRCYNLNLHSSNSWRLLHSWANTKQPMRDYGKNQIEKLLQTTCSFLGVRDRDQKIQNVSSDLVGG